MKILSYNIYGVVDTKSPIPCWEIRQLNIERILNQLLIDEEITVACFQEVTKDNIDMLSRILENHNFKLLEKFAMKTETSYAYNLVAVKKNDKIIIQNVFCLPHGLDSVYKELDKQAIDYHMSDYRTTVFLDFIYNNKRYLIGNIHTDYISTDGKIKGVIKSLDYLDSVVADYKLIIGDMNMISHMSEVYNILKVKSDYTTLSRSKDFNIIDQSWHGYGILEQVNVDFAFVPKQKFDSYNYQIIKQSSMCDEGSDHRPVIVDIND